MDIIRRQASPCVGRTSPLSWISWTRVALPDGQMAEDRAFGGRTLKFGTATTKLGEPLDLYFDPDTKLLVAYEVTETHPVLGDIHGTYEILKISSPLMVFSFPTA